MIYQTGAFNSVSVNTATDYGWGTYDANNDKVTGNGTLYGVELKDGSFKKIVLDSMASGTYYFRYADLNGGNLQQQTIVKSNYTNKSFAYFSLVNNATITAEVNGWDWVMTRYLTLLYTTSPPTPYTVGGILVNAGVEAVIADNINPITVDPNNYTLHKDSLTTIGHDWKRFTGSWSIEPNRVYFVKTQNNTLYQIEFLSFQGSSTGRAQFAKTNLGSIIGLDRIEHQDLAEIICSPNPASDFIRVVYTLRHRVDYVQVSLTDMTGRVVYTTALPSVKEGMNAATLALPDLPAAPYALTVKTDTDQYTEKVIIAQ